MIKRLCGERRLISLRIPLLEWDRQNEVRVEINEIFHNLPRGRMEQPISGEISVSMNMYASVYESESWGRRTGLHQVGASAKSWLPTVTASR